MPELQRLRQPLIVDLVRCLREGGGTFLLDCRGAITRTTPRRSALRVRRRRVARRRTFEESLPAMNDAQLHAVTSSAINALRACRSLGVTLLEPIYRAKLRVIHAELERRKARRLH